MCGFLPNEFQAHAANRYISLLQFLDQLKNYSFLPVPYLVMQSHFPNRPGNDVDHVDPGNFLLNSWFLEHD